MLNWYTDTVVAASDNASAFQVDLQIAKFFSGNVQFERNMREYHYVKFNYFAVHFNSVSHLGYQDIVTRETSPKAVPEGVTALNFPRMPFYCGWDLEDPIDLKTTTVVDMTQYPYMKKIYANSRKPAKFVYKVPQPWRQFYDTTAVSSKTPQQDIYGFFADVSGIRNIRSPTRIFGGHVNWWQDELPHNTSLKLNNEVFAKTILDITFYVGCTFRGRKIITA